MIWIGIDPGGSGGIAWITDGGLVAARRMPETEADILAALWNCASLSRAPLNGYAAIEHVWSTPGQGGAFKFGKSVGGLLMALTAVQIAFDQVLPRTWQKMLGVAYAKGLTDTEKKNITKRRAQQLFPALAITHATADALLLAEYCRRLHRGSHVEKQEQGVYSREEFERDAKGQTGEDIATRRRAGRRAHAGSAHRARERRDVPGAGEPEGPGPDEAREDLRR